MVIGEKGEKVAAIGELAGTIADCKGGDCGRCGGVTACGVPGSDEAGERAGELLRGEYWPLW